VSFVNARRSWWILCSPQSRMALPFRQHPSHCSSSYNLHQPSFRYLSSRTNSLPLAQPIALFLSKNVPPLTKSSPYSAPLPRAPVLAACALYTPFRTRLMFRTFCVLLCPEILSLRVSRLLTLPTSLCTFSAHSASAHSASAHVAYFHTSSAHSAYFLSPSQIR
jgi:hypothetical protein